MKIRIFIFGLLCLLVSKTVNAQTSFAPLVQKVMPFAVSVSATLDDNDPQNVVNQMLFTTSDGKVALGSGFVIRKDGYIATNRHVIENGHDIKITTFDQKVYGAELVGVDDLTDIAVLKVDAGDLASVTYGDIDQLNVGDWVLAVGNPFGLGLSVSAGIVSAKGRDIDDNAFGDFLQTDAAINQGNSGGPLFDANGVLVGMNTAIFSDSGLSSGVGFALPAGSVKWVVERLIKDGKVERSYIGVAVKSTMVNEGQAGLMIVSVDDKANLKKNDLRSGDMILTFDGRQAGSEKTFARYVSQLEIGSEIKLNLLRDGQTLEQIITTMPIPASEKPETESAGKENQEEGDMYYAVGLRIRDLKIMEVFKGSEADLKGIKKGDLIVKIDQHAALDQENVALYFNEAQRFSKTLRLDMEDKNGDSYYVELSMEQEK